MNAATLLTLAAGAIEVVMGTLAIAFARAQGWRHFRVFALIAFSAAAYCLLDAVFASISPSDTLVLWAGQLNPALGCLNCGAWIVYTRRQYGDPLRRLDYWVIGGLSLIALLAMVPGLFVTAPIVTHTVPWAAVTYHLPTVTALGSVALLLMPASLALPALTYVRKARAGAAGARVHVVAFLFMFAIGVNEAMVSAGVLNNLYLMDLGFLAAVLSVCVEMTYRVTGDARRLQELSDDLARQVDERTRELIQARDNLARAERLAALGRLSASIGHEINNPLSYVIGNLNYISEELNDEQSERQDALIASAVEDALGGAERIRRIVAELRAFGSSSERDARRPLDVNQLLEEALKVARGETRHRVRLERRYEQVRKVMADPIRLTQVCVNLVVNAAQSIPEERAGGPDAIITLRTRALPDDRLAIEITDTGVGIREDARERLFEPFFTTKQRAGGTGLGLFVSLGIVTGLGGSIEIDSRMGEGTTVRVILPVWQGVELEPEEIASASVRTLENRRLLVVDDDVLVARTLARQLSGHHVEVVSSGQAALERLSGGMSNFDLVLCDLMMPDMTGMEVYEAVEERCPALAERFVFISGGGVTERSRKFLEAHADRVLPKPIDNRQLSELLVRCKPNTTVVAASVD
jgi:signal transduction histidine kinase/ActR/RegA family two-component response regulator